jgi:hypothetical protein
MPPAPKHPSTRARRNKVSTAATLIARDDIEIPELPDGLIDGRMWHLQTLAFWEDVWRSPMAAEFDQSDIHGLFMLAVLVDGFWTKPHWTAAAEIRLQGQRFGLSPLDRRRLQWEIEKVDEAQAKGEQRRSRPQASTPVATTRKKPGGDPRDFLRVV